MNEKRSMKEYPAVVWKVGGNEAGLAWNGWTDVGWMLELRKVNVSYIVVEFKVKICAINRVNNA